MRKHLAVQYVLLILVNLWVLFAVVSADEWAIEFFDKLDVELPSITRMALSTGWIWPVCALILSVLGIVAATAAQVNERELHYGFCVIAVIELAGLAFQMVAILLPMRTLANPMGG